MAKELFSMAERLKNLREHSGRTQVELANVLGLTRSSVNAWEMGISIPSTPYIVELSKLYRVSTDHLLGMGETKTISVAGLSERQIGLLVELIQSFQADEE